MNAHHMRLLLPRSAKGAAVNIVSSSHVGSQLKALLDIPAKRICRVPLGVDYDFFSAKALPAACLPFKDGRPYLLFVGNIEPKKGLSCLIQAYAKVAASVRCDLVLAGRVAWKSGSLLKQIENYDGPGQIHILGRVPQADLPGLYQYAQAFVFPSLIEGFGLPILEAMAAGVPVVHSDHPVLLETAGDAGLPFAVGDSEDLAKTLLALHESEALRQELSEKGRVRAAEMTWQRWAKGVLSVIENIIVH